MYIDNLVIEVTRRCNLFCDHCLRGQSENIDFNPDYLVSLIENLEIDSINSITLSGGEPTLRIGIIKQIREILSNYKIDLNSFYLATNGINNNNPEFITEMLQWYLISGEREICEIQVSNDIFHDYNDLGLLQGLSFASYKYNDNNTDHYAGLINDGNAQENGIGNREETAYQYELENDYIPETVYLNCNGNLLSCCNLSYNTQDDEDTPF